MAFGFWRLGRMAERNAGSFEWTRGVPPLAHARKGVVILSRVVVGCC